MKLIFIVISLITSFQSIACSCVKQSSISESSAWANHVFVGKIHKIIDIKENDFPTKYFELDIVEVIKGKPTKGYFVKPSPIEMLTNCFPQKLEVGDLWVFFTKNKKETSFHHCSSSQPFEYLERSQPKWREDVSLIP